MSPTRPVIAFVLLLIAAPAWAAVNPATDPTAKPAPETPALPLWETLAKSEAPQSSLPPECSGYYVRRSNHSGRELSRCN